MKKKNKFLLASSLIACCMSPLVVYDFAYLGVQTKWSTFDKVRLKLYMESAGVIGAIMPAIGPSSGIHYISRLGNAYIDKDLPSKSTMNFLRDIVMNSSGTGKKGSSFRSRYQFHEDKAMRSGQSVYVSNIVQKVSFNKKGLPFSDYFAITMRTDIIDGKPQSSFIVWGLGIVADSNNPAGLGKQYDSIASIFKLSGSDLIRWTCNIEKNGMAKPYWVIITESEETSLFSHDYVKYTSAQRKNVWHKQTRTRHKDKKGKKVSEQY